MKRRALVQIKQKISNHPYNSSRKNHDVEKLLPKRSGSNYRNRKIVRFWIELISLQKNQKIAGTKLSQKPDLLNSTLHFSLGAIGATVSLTHNSLSSRFTVFLAFLFLLLAGRLPAQNADLKLLKSINIDRNTKLDPFYRQVSLSGYWLSISYPVSTLVRGYAKKDSVLWQQGLQECAGSGLCLALTIGLKYSIHRSRPYVSSSEIRPMHPLPDPNSFPSGHTSAAFATATHISMAYPKWYVVVPAFGWAGLVGYSRMHAGFHYPSDVLAGAVLGAGSAWLGQKATKWFFRKKKPERFRPF